MAQQTVAVANELLFEGITEITPTDPIKTVDVPIPALPAEDGKYRLIVGVNFGNVTVNLFSRYVFEGTPAATVEALAPVSAADAQPNVGAGGALSKIVSDWLVGDGPSAIKLVPQGTRSENMYVYVQVRRV